MEIQEIKIPHITLGWNDWYRWAELLKDNRSGGIHIPSKIPGVYEVKLTGHDGRLTIGKAADIRMRIRQGLIKGKTQHSSGKEIRSYEDTDKIEIRWAITDRPSAVEEELHRQYVIKHGKWPKYTKHT